MLNEATALFLTGDADTKMKHELVILGGQKIDQKLRE